MKNFLCLVYWFLCLSHCLGQTVTVNQLAQNQQGQVRGDDGQLGQNQAGQIRNTGQNPGSVNQLGQNQIGQVQGAGGQLGQNQGGQIRNTGQNPGSVNQLAQNQQGQVQGDGGQLGQNQAGQIRNTGQNPGSVNQLGQNQRGQVQGAGGQLGQNQAGQIRNTGQNPGSVNQLGQNQGGQVRGQGGQLRQNQVGQISNQGQNPMSQTPMGQIPMGQPPMGQMPMVQPPMGQNQIMQGQMGQDSMGSTQTRNMKNLNVGNPDEGLITRPCQPFDTHCIREFFASHGKCKETYGPVPDPYYRKQNRYFVPRANVTITTYNMETKGLNGKIQDFYVNQDTDKVVLVIEYRDVQASVGKDQLFFRFHRRGKEPVVTKGSGNATYPSVTMTAIIPKIHKLDPQRMVVFAYVNVPSAPVFSDSIFESTDPQVRLAQQAINANIRTVLQELYLIEAPFFPAVFIQRNLCDFGLELL